MNRGSTLFLKLVIALIAIAALAVCALALPAIAAGDARAHPELAWQQYPFLASAYLLCAIFLIGLYQAFQLLTDIDMNNAFSKSSAGAWRRLKYCAITICALMVAGIATLMVLARGKGEDIAGIVAMALLVTFASGVVAIVAAVLQKRVQKAVDLSLDKK